MLDVWAPLDRVTSANYDARHLPYVKTDPASNRVLYFYDVNGNLTQLEDENNHVTTYSCDGLDRLERKTFADGSYQTWIYDAGGRVTSQRTAAGNTISASYDARNELLTENYGSTITNTYDLLGRLLTATEGGAALTYTYDNLNRVSTFTDQAGRESIYTYDLAGNRLSSAYPTGITVEGAYDSSERLWKLKDGSGNVQATVSYDDADRVSGVSLANSTSVTPSFDLIDRLTSMNNALASSVNRNYGYTYDDASRITQIVEPRGTISSIQYSARDEVSNTTEPSGSPIGSLGTSTTPNTYEPAWNRSTWIEGSTTTSYTSNNLNEYTWVNSSSLTWTGDGCLSTFSGNTYIFDNLQRLTEVDNSSNKVYFTYDPFGRRVKKVVKDSTGTTTLATYQYHYDGSQVAVEYRPEATWTYYGGIMRTDGTNKQWYYRDGQGSVSAVADNSGAILEKYEYDAEGHFQIANGSGTVLSATGIGNDIMYTSQRYDPETGNYYDNARYYNPDLGRFISRDPLPDAEFSQGTNLYAYCGNNCLNEVDSSGLAPAGHWETEYSGGDLGIPVQVWVLNPPSAAVSQGGPNSVLTPWGMRPASPVALMQANACNQPGSGFALGFSFEFSSINPFTSGGGGAYGVNFEYTSSGGFGLYDYATPNFMPSYGFAPGFSITGNAAIGTGSWTGPFVSSAASFGPLTAGAFQSIPSSPGYTGYQAGAGFGPPGVGITVTNYGSIAGAK